MPELIYVNTFLNLAMLVAVFCVVFSLYQAIRAKDDEIRRLNEDLKTKNDTIGFQRARLKLYEQRDEGRPWASNDWALLLLARDGVQGRASLERMVEWYRENDGGADDFGRFNIVADAEDALAP